MGRPGRVGAGRAGEAQARSAGAGGEQARGARRRQERAGRWAARARDLGVPVRMVGMLAGSAGPVWVLVNLAQF